MPYCLPDDISPEQFLAEYWQQKPLLIKGGLPQLVGMFEPDDILGLATVAEATSRLITQNTPNQSASSQWQVKQSPLQEEDFNELPEQWTVLVQNLEQWSPELGQLWQAFGFIPQWQRDDIMVSFAPKGGSVGKHFDEYDVFLAQGFGSRRWQLGKYCDENTAFLPDEPIRIFDDMGTIIFDEILQPGDVLYVPPKLSHFGVAEDDCLTFSFGFRRPNLIQILDGLVDTATSEKSLFIPLLLKQSLQASGQLHPNSVDQIQAQLIELLQSSLGKDLLEQAVSESVSKRQYDLLSPEELVDIDYLEQALQEGAVIKPDYNSRLLYIENPLSLKIYVNGHQLENIDAIEARLLMRLADGEPLCQQDLMQLQSAVPLPTIMTWLENGWVWLDDGALYDQ